MTESKLFDHKSKSEGESRRFGQGAVQYILLAVLLVFISHAGCTDAQQKQPSAAAPVIVQPYQRFVPIAHGQGYLSFPYWAFDTKTGQLCKTWGWQFNTPASQKARETRDTSDLQGIDAAAAATHRCLELLGDSNSNPQQPQSDFFRKFGGVRIPTFSEWKAQQKK